MSDEKYRAILEKDPTDTQAFVALCSSAERNNDYQYLAQLYDFRAQVIADTKEIADLFFKSGEIYLDKLGETAKGVESLLKGFESDRTHAGIGDRLDAIYREAGDWESAVQIIEQRLDALSGADANGTKTIIRSDLHQQAGEIWEKVYADRKRALGHYKSAIELDKTNILALYGAREIYYQAGKFKNASKLCELEARAEKDPERRAALYRELAQIYDEKLEEIDQAVISLKRALKSTPQSGEIQSALAAIIAKTQWTRETAKDHAWATEYLLRLAADASGMEAVELAVQAVISTPTSTKALDFLEENAEATGNFSQLAATYEEIIAKIPNQNMRNTVISRLSSIYQIHLKDEVRAAHWRASIQAEDESFQVLGSEEPYQSLLSEEESPEKAASSIPAPPIPSSPGSHSSVPSPPLPSVPPAVNISKSGQLLNEAETIFDRQQGSMFDSSSTAQQSIFAASAADQQQSVVAPHKEPAPTESAHNTIAMPIREPGMTDEIFAETLRQTSDRARRIGDEASAEMCLLQVLDLFPYDQKAITFLERRFRSRSDWSSLRDLLLRSAGSPHLPPAVQTVRLREAARLSEEQLGDIYGAITAWNQIKENDPKVRDAVEALIRLFEKVEDWSSLQVLLVQEIETTKSRTKKVEAYRKLADIYFLHLGDFEAATDAYRNVLDLMPDDMSAIEALEDLYFKSSKFDEMTELLRKRADLTQNKAEKRDLLFRCAQVLRENLNRPEDAYTQAKALLAFSKEDQEVLAFLTALDEECGNWSRLMSVLELSIHAAPSLDEKAQLIRKKANCALEKLGDMQGAVNALNTLLSMIPDDIEAMDSLIDIHRKTENWESLAASLKKRIEASADRAEQAELYRECARVLEGPLHRESDAMESWKAVLEIQPDAESLGALSRYYERNEQWDSFVNVLEQQASYAEDHKQRADILYNRAVTIDSKLSNRPSAISELERILKEVDPSHDATLNLLTEILVAENRFSEAADLLDQRISYSQNPTLSKSMLLTLGSWCTQELKDIERAMDAYEKAVQIDKEDVAILEALEDVYTKLGQWDKLLKLLYARAKSASDDQVRFGFLTKGATICENNLADKKKAWTWYVEILDKLGHLEEAVSQVEQAARRMELWKELIDLAGLMTKKSTVPAVQVEWWLKAADILENNLNNPAQALEAVLRAFGLEPDNETLLDMVDRLAVNVQNWQRLSTVYGVLANRIEDKTKKIDLLVRYANVLKDKANRPSDAFEISIRAFELDPDSDELLQKVEELGQISQRWDDLVRIYNGCANLTSEMEKKVALKLRAAAMLKDKKGDTDAALVMILDALRLDPFEKENTEKLWAEIASLEADLVPSESGTYWNRLIETYRALSDEYKKDTDKLFMCLCQISEIYLDKLKNLNAAFEVLKENLSVNPKDDRTLDKLEELAGRDNNWRGLVDHYQDVLDETFDMEVAVALHRRRGRILQEHLQQPEEAAEHYWQIIQLDSSDTRAYEALVSHYEISRKWNDLVNILERQLDNTSDDEAKKNILLRIGSVWENEIGNRYEAKDWYEQALTIWPNDKDAVAAIDRLTKGDVRKQETEDDNSAEDDDEDIQALISMPPPPDNPVEEEPMSEENNSSSDNSNEAEEKALAEADGEEEEDETDEESETDEEGETDTADEMDQEDESVEADEDSENDTLSSSDELPIEDTSIAEDDAPWPVMGGEQVDDNNDGAEDSDLLLDDDDFLIEDDEKN